MFSFDHWEEKHPIGILKETFTMDQYDARECNFDPSSDRSFYLFSRLSIIS